MDGQGKGSVSLLDAAALLLASAVRNPLSGLHRPSGAAWSWPLGAGCPTSWQQMSVLSGRVCTGFLSKVRISVGGHNGLLLTE